MEDIFRKYYQELVYYGLKFIKNKQAVEDIVEDCFLKIFRDGYDPVTVRRYLYLSVKTHCIDFIRKTRRRDRIEKGMPQEESVELNILEAEVMRQLNAALESLPEESRKVVELYYLEEKQCAEIAYMLHKPVATVRSLKRYALNQLFKKLNKPC